MKKMSRQNNVSGILLFMLLGATGIGAQLAVTSYTPTQYQQYATAIVNIIVTFSDNIDTATVNANTFNVNGDFTGKIAGAFSITDNEVTFNPTSDFKPGEMINVTLTTGIESSTNVALADDITWQFFIASGVATGSFLGRDISTGADGAWDSYPADVDSDGDMDVLSASYLDDKVAWYENDGSESFTEHVITTGNDAVYSVYAADMEGDGDMDVFSASLADDKIAWYENNGAESFTEHEISITADGAFCVYVADVDSDGDLDVLSASYNDDKIAWYENNGSQSFSEHTISTSADSARCVYTADVDGDGDMDVLSASRGDDKIAWYENDGAESFTEHAVSTSADGAWSVYAADVDDDGDVDVLSASRFDNKVAWYENDGAESFTEHAIATSDSFANSVYVADMDGDGDMDVLSASDNDGKVCWHENDGAESFTEHIITTSYNGPWSVHAVDIDDDGDLDVVTTTALDDKVVWYENDPDYILTYIAGLNGNISGTTPQKVPHGDDGTPVQAVPDPNYHFVDWSDGKTDNPRTDTNVTANISVTANFAIDTYTLTYTSGTNGILNGNTLQIVPHGGNGTAVEAIPKIGHHFIEWSDGNTDNPRTDTSVTADISVTANFDINSYTLIYTAGTNGTINSTSPQIITWGHDGDPVTAFPNMGYHFVDWSDGNTDNPRTDTNVTADISVTANFDINAYTLTYTAGANGTITGSTPQTVNHGSNGTAVQAIPNTGYHFVDWSDGNTDNPRTDTNVTADIAVTANFGNTTNIINQHKNVNKISLGIVSVPNPANFKNGQVDILVNDGTDRSEIRLIIFDAIGNHIYEQISTANLHNIHRFCWNLHNLNGKAVASGIYKIIAVSRSQDGIIRKFTSLIGVQR